MGFIEDVDPILYYLGLSALMKHLIFYQWKDRKPKKAQLAGKVTELHLYPVKSFKDIKMEEIHCTPQKGAYYGTINDRYWMVVDTKYSMVSGRENPKLLGIQPKVQGSTLTLSADGCPDISIDTKAVEKINKLVDTIVNGVSSKGLDCGDEVSEWLNHYLQKPSGYHLLYSGARVYKRQMRTDIKKYQQWTREAKEEDTLTFHDTTSFHLCTTGSVVDLNTRLTAPINVMRFRPNIVVDTGGPYEEDDWTDIFIGNVRFRKIKDCSRCTVPNIDSTRLTKDEDNQPLKTLTSYRSLVKGYGPMFGVDLVVDRPGPIHVGDDVYVVKE